MIEITKALVKVQIALPKIAKGNTASIPTKGGGNFKYDYADLTTVNETLIPLLARNGLAWVTLPTTGETGNPALAYMLLHTSGESIEGIIPIAANANPQTIGSAITYYRRYALLAVIGVAPEGEDDDGKKAIPTPPSDAVKTATKTAATAQKGIDLNSLKQEVLEAAGEGGVARLGAEGDKLFEGQKNWKDNPEALKKLKLHLEEQNKAAK